MVDLKTKRHLFFDFDDTLWDFQKNSALVLKQLFEEFNLQEKIKVGFENFERTYKQVNQELWKSFYRREIDKQYLRNERFNLVFKEFGYDNYAENLSLTQLYLTRAPRGPFLKEGCLDTLNYLKQNYELHIITNGFKESQDIKLVQSGLQDYFTHIIISEVYALMKPDEKLFRLAESLSGANSHECVMIGDSLESDVEGALNAGWDAVYFSEKSNLEYTGTTISHLAQLKAIF